LERKNFASKAGNAFQEFLIFQKEPMKIMKQKLGPLKSLRQKKDVSHIS